MRKGKQVDAAAWQAALKEDIEIDDNERESVMMDMNSTTWVAITNEDVVDLELHGENLGTSYLGSFDMQLRIRRVQQDPCIACESHQPNKRGGICQMRSNADADELNLTDNPEIQNHGISNDGSIIDSEASSFCSSSYESSDLDFCSFQEDSSVRTAEEGRFVKDFGDMQEGESTSDFCSRGRESSDQDFCLSEDDISVTTAEEGLNNHSETARANFIFNFNKLSRNSNQHASYLCVICNERYAPKEYFIFHLKQAHRIGLGLCRHSLDENAVNVPSSISQPLRETECGFEKRLSLSTTYKQTFDDSNNDKTTHGIIPVLTNTVIQAVELPLQNFIHIKNGGIGLSLGKHKLEEYEANITSSISQPLRETECSFEKRSSLSTINKQTYNDSNNDKITHGIIPVLTNTVSQAVELPLQNSIHLKNGRIGLSLGKHKLEENEVNITSSISQPLRETECSFEKRLLLRRINKPPSNSSHNDKIVHRFIPILRKNVSQAAKLPLQNSVHLKNGGRLDQSNEVRQKVTCIVKINSTSESCKDRLFRCHLCDIRCRLNNIVLHFDKIHRTDLKLIHNFKRCSTKQPIQWRPSSACRILETGEDSLIKDQSKPKNLPKQLRRSDRLVDIGGARRIEKFISPANRNGSFDTQKGELLNKNENIHQASDAKPQGTLETGEDGSIKDQSKLKNLPKQVRRYDRLVNVGGERRIAKFISSSNQNSIFNTQKGELLKKNENVHRASVAKPESTLETDGDGSIKDQSKLKNLPEQLRRCDRLVDNGGARRIEKFITSSNQNSSFDTQNGELFKKNENIHQASVPKPEGTLETGEDSSIKDQSKLKNLPKQLRLSDRLVDNDGARRIEKFITSSNQSSSFDTQNGELLKKNENIHQASVAKPEGTLETGEDGSIKDQSKLKNLPKQVRRYDLLVNVGGARRIAKFTSSSNQNSSSDTQKGELLKKTENVLQPSVTKPESVTQLELCYICGSFVSSLSNHVEEMHEGFALKSSSLCVAVPNMTKSSNCTATSESNVVAPPLHMNTNNCDVSPNKISFNYSKAAREVNMVIPTMDKAVNKIVSIPNKISLNDTTTIVESRICWCRECGFMFRLSDAQIKLIKELRQVMKYKCSRCQLRRDPFIVQYQYFVAMFDGRNEIQCKWPECFKKN